MTDTSLRNLNEFLFNQLERLDIEVMDADQVAKEAERTKAIVAVADRVIASGSLMLEATTVMAEHGVQVGCLLPTSSEADTPRIAGQRP